MTLLAKASSNLTDRLSGNWEGEERREGAAFDKNCEEVSGQQGRVHQSRVIYGVGSHYQATSGENTAEWEDWVHAIVNFKVRKSVKWL
jgi:hypothetical protein